MGVFTVAFFQTLYNSQGTQGHFALPAPSELNPSPPNKWSQSQDHSVTALVTFNSYFLKFSLPIEQQQHQQHHFHIELLLVSKFEFPKPKQHISYCHKQQQQHQ